ncbi:phosphatase PAP2 family protein [Rubritalea profundi]|uniref:Phosphatidic acid phosphatase type 2/haloperoxidase domain-containing protein n=1 Tax=Rubritalea profundi TaxID=1658618 RepID=A0A2S7U3Q8_9BACT|nr:phosphatase PAP2 family protein [Rubritalea profundi]PQJ29147.1 hypothetical protein BSZ32_12025 [Rubritalea profundi]
MKIILLFSLILSAVAVAEPLSFSVTQSWNKRYLKLSTTTPKFLTAGWKVQLLPDTPPTNTSVETHAELATLLQRQKQRTNKDVLAIKREIKPSGHRFLGVSPLSTQAKKLKPHTYQLLSSVNTELAKVVFYYKHHFNRVSPSYLESQLTTAIPNPAHPAYPSGHAKQSMTFALLLAEILPAKREQLIGEAKIIARNREIAGVHYASDSDAGFVLAQGLVKEFLNDPQFLSLLQGAKLEW